MSVDPRAQAQDDPTATEDLEDGQAPDEDLAVVVDDLEEQVLRDQENPVLEVGQDADAAAVESDPEHGDEPQPPV